MPREVFLSYASEDIARAGQVCAALESAQHSCWMAPRDVEPGADYPSAIVDAIASCEAMVVLLTDHAMASRHVASEVGHAFNAAKRIVPVRFTSAPLSKDLDYFLTMAHWLDAGEELDDAELARLIAGVESALREEAPVPKRARPTTVWILAASAVLLAIAGFVYWQSNRVVPAPGTTPKSPDVPPPVVEKAPQNWVNPLDRQEYVAIPAGTFTMGCSPNDGQCEDDEKPAHPVNIPKFWLARTEATRDGKMPITQVTWDEARKHCAKVGGRLPTEAEWEYAARGGQTGAYYGPPLDIAWYDANSDDAPHPVAQKKANAYGLFDMLGNVAEWVLDRYYNQYDVSAPATGPAVELPNVSSNASAISRGSFWAGDAAAIRVSNRRAHENDAADVFIGFRCAIDR